MNTSTNHTDKAIILDKIKKGEANRQKEKNKKTKEEIHFIDSDAKTEFDTEGCANDIWHIVKPLIATPWFLQSYESKIDEFYKKYPKFCTTFPVIIKYMINDGIFSHKAFKLYLMKLKTHSPKTKEEWAERQADYIKFCVLETGKPGCMNRANQMWQEVKQGLMEDMDDLTNDLAEAKKKAEEDIKELSKKRRVDLTEKLTKDNQLRVEFYKLLKQKQENKPKEEQKQEPTTKWMTIAQRDEYLKQQREDPKK